VRGKRFPRTVFHDVFLRLWYTSLRCISPSVLTQSRASALYPPLFPQTGMNESTRILRHESTIRRALWPPLVAMGVLAALLLSLVWRLLDTVRAVEESDQRIRFAHQTLRYAIDMETGKRGFLLTGDHDLLEPYNIAEKEIDHSFAEWLAVTPANTSQFARVQQAQAAFNTWHTDAKASIDALRNAPPEAFITRLNDKVGKDHMNTVRKAVDAYVELAEATRKKRTKSVTVATQWSLWGGAGFTLFAGGMLAWMTRGQLQTLSDQYETVIEAEQRVRERLATTLTSIGDGVLVTDSTGHITLINPVTERLTGWTQQEAQGKESKVVFDIVHEETGDLMPNPVDLAIRENRIVLLANHTVLRRRDGTMIAIEDSAAPVRDAQGKVTGVVLVFRNVTERKQHEHELAVAMSLARFIAETLQQSMLLTPPPNAFPGMRLTTLYEPAWDEAQVGGDFYDAFTYWPDRVVLLVGDATGKGLDAATMTSEVKYALRAYLYEDDDPGRAMTRLNRFLTNEERQRPGSDAGDTRPPLSFISMAIAVVNTTTGEGRCAVAGAEAPLLLSAQGETAEAGVSGAMLGAAAEIQYESSYFTMGPGDLLIFTTDGITEARRGRREFFGYEGFTQAIKNATRGGTQTSALDQIAGSIVAEAREYAGGKLQDDVCLLIAQRK